MILLVYYDGMSFIWRLHDFQSVSAKWPVIKTNHSFALVQVQGLAHTIRAYYVVYVECIMTIYPHCYLCT